MKFNFVNCCSFVTKYSRKPCVAHAYAGDMKSWEMTLWYPLESNQLCDVSSGKARENYSGIDSLVTLSSPALQLGMSLTSLLYTPLYSSILFYTLL